MLQLGILTVLLAAALFGATRLVSAQGTVRVDTGLAIFHLSMLPDLFGVPREAISGDEMVARLDHTLFA